MSADFGAAVNNRKWPDDPLMPLTTEYYASIIACIKPCTDACVPTVNSYVTKHNVPACQAGLI